MGISGEKIVSRIDKILEGKEHVSRADACRYAKINERAMTDWATKGTIPAADTLYLVAEFLGTTVEYLVTGKDKSGVSLKERDLLAAFRLLDARDQEDVLGIIQGKVERAKKTAASSNLSAADA